MRLGLEWPPTWTATLRSQNLVEIEPEPGLVIRMRAAVPLPAGVVTWISGVMREDAPANASAREVRATRVQTSRHGWPVSISEYVFERMGEIVEHRLGVFYRLLYNGAELVLHARDSARYAAEAPAILERFLAGGVAWPQSRTATLFDLTELAD